MAKDVAEEYSSSLADLTVNSKPLINMLTMLAEDYLEHSVTIVKTVEAHLQKVPAEIKLPVLYLIDSIVKNVGKGYIPLFTQNIVSTFCFVFEQVDEKTRSQMFKLRQTWNEVFPAKKLYALDARVNAIDPAWPITAQPPHGRIHVNPKFLNTVTPPVTESISTSSITSIADTAMRGELLKKQKELLELQKRKVELELLQTKAFLEEQQKKLETQTATRISDPPSLVKPNITKQEPEPSGVKVSNVEVKPDKPKLEGTKRRDPRLNSRKASEPNNPRLSSKKESDPKLSSKRGSEPKPSSKKDIDPRLNSKKVSDPRLSSKKEGDPRLRSRKENQLAGQDNVNKLQTTNKDPRKASSVESKKTNESTSKNGSSRSQKKKSDKHRKTKEYKPRMKVLFGDSSPEHRGIKNGSGFSKKSASKDRDVSKKVSSIAGQGETNQVKDITHKNESPEPSAVATLINKTIPGFLSETKEENKEDKGNQESPNKDSGLTSRIKTPDPPSIAPVIDLSDNEPYCPESELVHMDVDYKPIEEPESPPPEATPMEFQIDETPVSEPPVAESEAVVFVSESHTSDLPAANECGDTDLRLLVPQSTSADTEQPPEMIAKPDLDLFGAEDVDLRQSLVPPPPPPPIISKGEGWANFKRSNSDRGSSGKSPKKRKFVGSSPRSSIFRKKDDDNISHAIDTEPEERQDSLLIIMKEAEEQLKNETITYAQYNQMLKGVMSMNEENKLQEALMKDDYERVDSPETDSNCSADVQQHLDKEVHSPDSWSHSAGGEGRPGNEEDLPTQTKSSSENSDHTEGRRRSRFKNIDPYHRSSKSSRHSRFSSPNDPPYAYDNKPWMSRQQQPPAFGGLRSRKEGGYRWQFPSNRQKPSEYSIIGPPVSRMRGPRHHPDIALPLADPAVLELIDSDPMTSVNVGNGVKEVRFYGENAIVMMDWDDPRDLMFQPGSRRVFIDGVDVLTLQFNATYREVTLSYGLRIRIRLGAPTRELFIDGRFYEVKFGGPAVEVSLGGRKHLIQLEGPLPYLSIGTSKRLDLVAGKVNLIVDGKIDNIFPIYLDAKPQRFEINGMPLIIRFVEALQTVVINGQPLKITFGGLPVPIVIRGERHFLRLTSLPPGITPGLVNILNMEGTPPPPRLAPPPPMISDLPPLAPPAFLKQSKPFDFPANNQPPYSASMEFPQYSVSDKPVDMLTSLMSSSVPRYAVQNYQVEPFKEVVPTSTAPTTATPSASVLSTPSIDVIELYQKLVAMGVVPKKKEFEKEEPEDKSSIKPVDFARPETLKLKQPGLINRLYSGIQCSSCGIRFSPEQTVKYSQHLDWHFRQNRRERNSSRIAQSRRWYYDVSDWIQYQEIEDDEDRAQSWFEIQDKKTTGEEEEETLEPTVPAKGFGENPCCTVCRDKFDQFFNEDKEEWQLKRAVCVEDKLYHPVCLKDQQESQGKNVGHGLMPVPEDEPIETIDLDAGGDSGEEEKINLETIDIESSSKSPEETDEKLENTESEKVEEQPTVEEQPAHTEETDEKMEEGEPQIVENEAPVEEKMEEVAEDSDDDILEIEVIKPHIESYDILDDDEEEEENLNRKEEDEEDEQSENNGEKKDSSDGKEDEEQIVLTDEIKADIVIKTEPIDHINPILNTNTSHINETIYLDGNSEFSAPKMLLPKKIKINISSMTTKNVGDETGLVLSHDEHSMDSAVVYDLSEPLPPGEEPVLTGPLKPKLIGMRLADQAPVKKGKEMSGLCTIM